MKHILLFRFYPLVYLFIYFVCVRSRRQTANYRENGKQRDTDVDAQHKNWSIQFGWLHRGNVWTQRHRELDTDCQSSAEHHVHAHRTDCRRQLFLCDSSRECARNVGTESTIRTCRSWPRKWFHYLFIVFPFTPHSGSQSHNEKISSAQLFVFLSII